MSENKQRKYEKVRSPYPIDSGQDGSASSPDKSPTSQKCIKKRMFLTSTTSDRPLIESARYTKMADGTEKGNPLESTNLGLHCNKKRDFYAWVNPPAHAVWNQQIADLGSKKGLVGNAEIVILRVF